MERLLNGCSQSAFKATLDEKKVATIFNSYKNIDSLSIAFFRNQSVRLYIYQSQRTNCLNILLIKSYQYITLILGTINEYPTHIFCRVYCTGGKSLLQIERHQHG